MTQALVTLPPYSMWQETNIYTINDPDLPDPAVIFGLMQDAILPDPTDTLYSVQQKDNGRLDSLSNRFLGTPLLWWAIAIINNLTDPMAQVVPGTVLRIPTLTRVQSLQVAIN